MELVHRMERVQQMEREKQWNSHVREEIRVGGRRRVIRFLTGVTWMLLLAAAGAGACAGSFPWLGFCSPWAAAGLGS